MKAKRKLNKRALLEKELIKRVVGDASLESVIRLLTAMASKDIKEELGKFSQTEIDNLYNEVFYPIEPAQAETSPVQQSIVVEAEKENSHDVPANCYF
jgi:hypothetical protein